MMSLAVKVRVAFLPYLTDATLTAEPPIPVVTVVASSEPTGGAAAPLATCAENCTVLPAPAATALYQYNSSPAVHGHAPEQLASPACACVTVVSFGTLAYT